MSRASEWAKAQTQIRAALDTAPLFVGWNGGVRVANYVNVDGDLTLTDCVMDPDRAILFARWILATFGEA